MRTVTDPETTRLRDLRPSVLALTVTTVLLCWCPAVGPVTSRPGRSEAHVYYGMRDALERGAAGK